jgi:uncharacterized protein YcfL
MRKLLIATLACAALALAGCATSPAAPVDEPALIEDSRAALGLPGMAVAIWREVRIAE